MKGRIEHFEAGAGITAPTQPKQFHGARRQISDTHVRPPSVTGAPAVSSHGFSSGSDRPPHTELAFATNSESSAWGYARTNGSFKTHPENNDPDPKWRARVYEVEPSHDQFQRSRGDEIESPTGFRIKAEHLSAPGDTSTFHELNWNAFKSKAGNSRYAPSGDANHSYMETKPVDPHKEPFVHVLKEAGGYQHRDAVDPRHPDQLNGYTGKTVAEHRQFENTPGVMIHLNPKQFDTTAFSHDPTVTTIRRSKDYHRADEQLGTVHG